MSSDLQAILKYPLSIYGPTEAAKGAEFLYVGEQFGSPFIWARVDPDAEIVKHIFYVVGTGHTLNREAGTYVGTVMLERGALVYHVFNPGVTV